MPVLPGEKAGRAVLSRAVLTAARGTARDQFSAGGVPQPPRTVVEVGDAHAFYGVMPAYISRPPALGTKLVSVYHSNAAVGLPTPLATIVLLDPRTGARQAVMDGRYTPAARRAGGLRPAGEAFRRPGGARLRRVG